MMQKVCNFSCVSVVSQARFISSVMSQASLYSSSFKERIRGSCVLILLGLND